MTVINLPPVISETNRKIDAAAHSTGVTKFRVMPHDLGRVRGLLQAASRRSGTSINTKYDKKKSVLTVVCER